MSRKLALLLAIPLLAGSAILANLFVATGASAQNDKTPPAAVPAVATPAAPLMPAVNLPAAVGQSAPDFTLNDTDGVEHKLSDYLAAGKIVVLEWFSPACPACKAYYSPGEDGSEPPMEKIIHSVAGDDLVWLNVNSSGVGKGGDGLELNATTKAEWGTPPILLDESGQVGKAFGAKRTPHLVVIAPDGKLRYRGAPDDREVSPEFPGINFIARAVTAIRGHQPVTIMETAPFG